MVPDRGRNEEKIPLAEKEGCTPLVRSVESGLKPPAFFSVPSVASFSNFFADKDFSVFRNKANNGSLLQGPRRVMRLCLFGLLLPVFLISIPLYVRLILYPPYQMSFAPTDQRLLNNKVSSIWCSSQSVHMNGTFNAYMLPEEPMLKAQLETHHMLHHIVLKDDVKEFWGFFLLKGSIVKIKLCNRYDGGSLMIMRGADNLRKCAWIIQEDSKEQDEDEEDSNESGQAPYGDEPIPETIEFHNDNPNLEAIGIGSSRRQSPKFQRKEIKLVKEVPSNISSAERKELLKVYLEKIMKLSKNTNEIIDGLTNHDFNKLHRINKKLKNEEIKKKDGIVGKDVRKTRLKRALDSDAPDLGGEQDDTYEGMKFLNPFGDIKVDNPVNMTEDELYSQIYRLPEGLQFERGTVNLTTKDDQSNEEHRSSFSSSEEALANCEGLLGAIPLYSDRMCAGFGSHPTNKITYKIPKTGTYYFVFSSDNEITDSHMFFNMTLLRVVYDTSHPKETCFNQTDCSLSFSFWSHDQAVVEVPENNWNATYILNSRCEPRVPVYLCILILIPIAILFCAFH